MKKLSSVLTVKILLIIWALVVVAFATLKCSGAISASWWWLTVIIGVPMLLILLILGVFAVSLLVLSSTPYKSKRTESLK